MKINQILERQNCSVSFEVFPPKKRENFEAVLRTALAIANMHPSFMSVTYGAGGATDRYTVAIARQIQEKCAVPALAHLTCVGQTKQGLAACLADFRANGIENILALRGDLPDGGVTRSDYTYAAQMIADIRASGDFCVGAACYPEGHVECPSPALDRLRLKQKTDVGVDFLTAQMFFDNDLFYKFLYQIRDIGIQTPVIAGIMPVTNGKQIERICKLSGTYLPARFRAIVDKFGSAPSAMQQAGIIYACEQIVDLFASGHKAIHVYSMNKPAVAQAIMDNLKELLGENQSNVND
ncbi:MAG: methylenetetrahydrofolate reductase [Oscillospiraceae bacterium]|nr:methylenetetrahydrofolate reductase [Oscillospiraceae bacterium]